MNAVTIACDNWDPLESYGQIAGELAQRLSSDHGIQINAVTGRRPPESINSPKFLRLLKRPTFDVSGGIVLGYPTLYDQYGPAVAGGPKLAITMFESTALPAGWATALERCAAVVVPSPWLIDVFRAAGVTRPIHVIPLGVSERYQLVPRPAGRRPFTFLMIASPGLRKGWDVAVRAFAAAFGEDPAYRLVIKIRAGRKLNARILHPRVEILAADFDTDQMQELYASVDAFVCPSRGEGFGLPPREAAATGLPVIATAWGGTADAIDEWGFRLTSSLTVAWPHHRDHPRCGLWAEPDVGHLASLMKQVAAEGSEELEARRRSQQVRACYAWDRFAAGIRDAWREVIDASPPARRPARRRPQVVIHARAEIAWHGPFVAAVAEGLRACGVPFAVTDERVRGDAGLPLLLGTTFWREIEANGPYLLVDRCSFGDPGRFVSLVRDGHGRRGDHRVPERVDATRWEQHGVPVLPWRPRGDRVVLCGQTEPYSPHYGRIADWYASVVGACSHFRRHPASRPNPAIDAAAGRLPETRYWDDCGRAVTLNSSVAVDAVLLGIPTVTMDEAAMAWDVTARDATETTMPDRTTWLHWLAWTQWSHQEIREGTPWPRFLD
jgi:glycosyltransferase involved in cell wall biosynthesis